jgi:hypothetical protein
MVRAQVSFVAAPRRFLTLISGVFLMAYSGRYYALEVVQNPVRARMCGFGDKVCLFYYYCPAVSYNKELAQDRRPLAPAAVCKMIVTREDNSLVDEE